MEINIKVKYFGQLKNSFGIKEKVYKLNKEILLGSLLRNIIEENPSVKNTLIDTNTGMIKEFYSVMINGRRVESKLFNKKYISDGDEVLIVPPVGGG